MSKKQKLKDPVPSQTPSAEEDDTDSSSGEESDLSKTSSGEQGDDDSSSDKEIIPSKPSATQIVYEIPSDDEEWKKLEIEELEIILRYYEVKLEQTKFILQVLKSRAGH